MLNQILFNIYFYTAKLCIVWTKFFILEKFFIVRTCNGVSDGSEERSCTKMNQYDFKPKGDPEGFLGQ